jgi:4-diphosphocytidyl-2-C-methyl-D-erythritol kinase
MTVFPPCKVNVGLQVISRRADGFHEIATVFYPLPLCDVLEIVSAPEGASALHLSGNPVPGDPDDNLCMKAYRMLRKDYPGLPEVDLYLHKVIPTGAGLGGGSSDAAATLSVLNDRYALGVTDAALADYASRLGSDCAFFLQQRPCYATGRGEELHPVTLEDLGGYHFVLVCPPIQVSTPWAYSQVEPRRPERPLPELLGEPVAHWKVGVVNDFEKPVFARYPVLADIVRELYRQGACYASMSGSGAALFGIFPPGALSLNEEGFRPCSVFRF